MTKPTGRPVGRPPKSRKDAQDVTRTDGWLNITANLGNGANNRTTRTKYAPVGRIPRNTLDSIYRGDGLGRRVIDVPVDDALREWIEADTPLLDELSRIKAKAETVDAAKWARLYGGCVVVALVDDGGDFDQPINMGSIRRVHQLRTYERHRVTWTTGDVDLDPMSPWFGEPLYYTVQPTNGATYRVHRSRLWRFDGLSIPPAERQRNDGWGDSALSGVYEALKNYGSTMNASAEIVQDFVQTVLGIKGLTDMLRQGQDDLVTKRATIIDLTRSVANTIFTDADGETYSKQSSSVAGLADLWDRFALHVSSSTGIPATKLLGRSPQGMNATGESDMRQWYDVVQAYRRDELEPFINWLVELLGAQSEWQRADRPETMEWQWPSLWQPSEAEWATIKKTNAETDAIYVQLGAVDAEYIAHLRFGQGEYRPDITIDYADYLVWLAEREGLSGEDYAEPTTD